MRALGVVVLVAGCNAAFDLDPTVLVTFDRDDDGIDDPLDNCPDVANGDQHDEDADTIGDRCDNCPLVANGDQQELGDDDGVGDACDPRPNIAGDCLIAFDTLAEPSAFDAHWSVLGETPDTPDVRAEPGFVTITPHAAYAVGLVARGLDGAVLTGAFDVQVAARSAPIVEYDAVVGAMTSSMTARGGYVCSIFGNQIELVLIGNNGGPGATSLLTSEPVLDALLLRVSKTGMAVDCRAEHGVAVGALQMSVSNQLVGGAGITVRKIATRFDAFAAYEARPGAACPEVIWR